MTSPHTLKCDPESFDAVWDGSKSHEIRFNDRNFKVGDEVHLAQTKYTAAMMAYRPEFYNLEYTGKIIKAVITHMQSGYGLARDWCVLSLRVTHRAG